MPADRAGGGVGPGLALGCLLGCLLAFRYLVLVKGHAPATVDSGNWLAYGHALLGEHLRSSSIVYPPLVPLIVTSAVSLLGAVRGVAAVAALASLAPAIGLYVVLRFNGERWLAVVLAALVAAAGSTGEATAWGGVPQLLGLGLGLLFLWQLDRYLASGRMSCLLSSALWMALLAATSDLITGGIAVAAAVLLALRLTLCRAPGSCTRRQVFGRLWLVALPSIVLVPLYAHMLQAALASGAHQPAAARLTASKLPSHIEFLYRDFRPAWRVALMVAVVSPFFLFDRRRQQLWVLLTALLGAVALTASGLHEDRFVYMLPIAIVVALAAWHEALSADSYHRLLRIARLGLAVLLVGMLAVQCVTGAERFRQQRSYYGILNPDLVAAIDWLRSSTPPGSIVAVPSIRNAPLGWWVEGLGHRLTLQASPLRWLIYTDERNRAQLANAIFTSEFPDTATLALAAHEGATYILLPADSDIIDPARLAAFVFRHPSAVAFGRPRALVLRLDRPLR